MGLCGDYGPFEFESACIRASWAAILPAAFVFALCITHIPVPQVIIAKFSGWASPFGQFLTLHHAELTLDAKDEPGELFSSPNTLPHWRTIVFVFVGIVECLCWTANGIYNVVNENDFVWSDTFSFMLAASWLYSILRLIARPSATPPYDLFLLYLILFATALLDFGGILFNYAVFSIPFPSAVFSLSYIANLLAILALLIVIITMPIAIPSNKISAQDVGLSVSLEDYTTLWGWISFSWVYPLIKKGRYITLHEKDVWNLSPTMQSRPVFLVFNTIHRSSLLRKLWAANSSDFITEFLFSYLGVIFNYAGPFFLKRILDALDIKNVTPESLAQAYIYAFLAFVCSVLKSQCEAQHLWYARRIATRIRSELMASIYDKALKRKDFSGITNKDPHADEPNGAKGKGKEKVGKKNGKDKVDDPKAGANVGKVVNLMSGDTTRVARIDRISIVYLAPFEILVAGIFLYQLLGLSAFAGIFVILAGWPVNRFLSRRRIRIQKGLSTARDKRMNTLNELIKAVKFIKFFAWEERWIARVLDVRKVELKWIRNSRINSVLFTLLWGSAPILVSIISFFAYVMQGNQLTIGIAFTAIALFGMIKAPLTSAPLAIFQILQTRVALTRISVYLEEEEVTEQVSSLKKGDVRADEINGENVDEGLGLEGATLRWNAVVDAPDKQPATPAPTSQSTTAIDDSASEESVEADRVFELRDLSIKFPEGRLTVITGPTASGKTALLMSVLGEMTLTQGRIIVRKDPSRVDENGYMHSISYAAQTPWLRHQSIKDNILFGYPLHQARYESVIECCALNPDLDMLEDGDATEIGARGVNLSGGQKARVALARAVYARTKYVLLDDPLSAVDSHTSRFLYERLLRGPLLANRTVLLVTHHVELVLPGAHYLVRMLDGRIDTHGTVEDLQMQGVLEGIKRDEALTRGLQATANETTVEQKLDNEAKAEASVATKKTRKLVKDEHREFGGVKWAIYNTYLKASSYWTWAALALLVAVAQILGVSEKLWIKIWGGAYQDDSASDIPLWTYRTFNHQLQIDTWHSKLHAPEHLMPASGAFSIKWPRASEHPLFYVGVYAAIGLASVGARVLSVTTQYTGALRASRILFKELLATVVRATFRFHDTTPQGRMLNRFGKDIETIDSNLAGSLQSVNASLATFIASMLTVAVVFPYFLIPAFFLGLAYRELALGYLNTGRDLRRMESNTRSPIFSDFGEILEGIVTVRAFSAEGRFLDNLHTKIDTTNKMWYTFWMTNRWLLLNFDILGAIAVLVTMLFSIITLRNNAGLAGLCITSAMAFTQAVYWACRNWTTLELDLNAVERVVEYLDLPQEPPAIIESNRVPASWPSSSRNDSLIVVEKLEIKYAPELPAVLHDVSFSLKAGERVGLLGRTGSGKSTLAMSILRFVDPTSGNILIDGIDISTIGTHDLRSRLTFIPQDATLFSGTIRDNLDPFGEHTDADCLDVLRRVHMVTDPNTDDQRAPENTTTKRPEAIDAASVTPTAVDNKLLVTLESQVSPGGANFSQGQRQLLALARALLRHSSIVILDEATSSIDFATDAKIQATIRAEFTDSLLLTVAHRLRTVIDYDRILVLDGGHVAEFDTPWNLINKEEGVFRNMCLNSGSFAELEGAAKAASGGFKK